MDKEYPTSLDCMDYSFCFDDNFYIGQNGTNNSVDKHLNQSKINNVVNRTPRKLTDYDFIDDDTTTHYDNVFSDDYNPTQNEYRYISDSGSEIDKVKTKLTSLWNNVKYGWTAYVRKTRTNFDKNTPICILGRFYVVDEDNLDMPQKSLTQSTLKDDYFYVTPTDRKTEFKYFEQDIYTRLWFTYRKNFPPINGTKYTSDCGWGCMLRSVQMLIAQGFLLHFLGRNWNLFQSTSRQDHFLNREIISWFNDRPGNKCPFGIHRLLDIADKMGKKVGDWFGPGSVTLIMKDALEQAKEFITILDDKLRIYVAQDCTIYKQDVIDLCTKNIRRQSSISSTTSDTSISFVPVILLISVRLGGEDLNEIYVPTLKMFLEMENCLGIIGGKPKHSLYFIGYQDDKIIYLDPHVCQDCVNISDNNFEDTSFHCEIPSKTAFNKLDPSLAIGFYCKTFDDFENFCSIIKNSTINNNKLKEADQIHPVFSICDDYYETTHLNYRLMSLDEATVLPNNNKTVDLNTNSKPSTFKHYSTTTSNNKFLKVNKPKMNNFTKFNKLLTPQSSRTRSSTSKDVDDFVLL